MQVRLLRRIAGFLEPPARPFRILCLPIFFGAYPDTGGAHYQWCPSRDRGATPIPNKRSSAKRKEAPAACGSAGAVLPWPRVTFQRAPQPDKFALYWADGPRLPERFRPAPGPARLVYVSTGRNIGEVLSSVPNAAGLKYSVASEDSSEFPRTHPEKRRACLERQIRIGLSRRRS